MKRQNNGFIDFLLEFLWYIKYAMYEKKEQVRRINIPSTFYDTVRICVEKWRFR